MQAVFSRVSDLDMLAPTHAKHTGKTDFSFVENKNRSGFTTLSS